eukprot:Rhum_TRINITY_DN14749_c1_g2::Rhum_TRINITY_DN14749_c1_g2_i1::g.116572::m.116572
MMGERSPRSSSSPPPHQQRGSGGDSPAAAPASSAPASDGDPDGRGQSRRLFEARYAAACRELGVAGSAAAEALHVSADGECVALHAKGCGEQGARALAQALRGRSLFSAVSVRDSFMGDAGAAALCDALLACPSPPVRLELTGANLRGGGARAAA